MTSQAISQRFGAAAVALAISLTPAFAGDAFGVPNFQKVNDQVYRGAQPDTVGFASLAKLGVKTIIDLREIGEHSQAEEEKMVKAIGMNYVSIPMRGMSAPTQEQISKVLGLLNDASAGPVFVHCRRGADRTGTVLACYRISHDRWDNSKALSEAKHLGMSMFERAMQSYVRHFQSSTVNAATPQPAAAAAATQ